MVVGDDVGLVDEDGGEDGVSVEYVRLNNVVTVGLGEEEDGGDDGESVIYVVVGMPVVDDA